MKKTFLRAAAVVSALILAGARMATPSDTKVTPDEYVYKDFASIEVLKTYLERQSGGADIDTPIAIRLSGVNLSKQENKPVCRA